MADFVPGALSAVQSSANVTARAAGNLWSTLRTRTPTTDANARADYAAARAS